MGTEGERLWLGVIDTSYAFALGSLRLMIRS
jgi:hypothetical protein